MCKRQVFGSGSVKLLRLVLQCKLCRRPEIHGAVLEGVDTPVGVQTTRLWFRQSEHWILREMTLFMGAMLGSTVIHILR